jgi:hypothetical protein
MDAQVSDETVMSQLSALLEEMPPRDLSREEYRGLRIAIRRAQSGSLTPQEEFFDAREFFSSEIVEALQERTAQIIEAIRWLARPGPGKQERLLRLNRLINTTLGFDFLTFCYLVHVAQLASLPSGSSRTGQ